MKGAKLYIPIIEIFGLIYTVLCIFDSQIKADLLAAMKAFLFNKFGFLEKDCKLEIVEVLVTAVLYKVKIIMKEHYHHLLIAKFLKSMKCMKDQNLYGAHFLEYNTHVFRLESKKLVHEA